jgi:hypothetical protein
METKEQREQRLAKEIATSSYGAYTWSAEQNYSTSGYGIPWRAIPKRERIPTVSDKIRRLPIK